MRNVIIMHMQNGATLKIHTDKTKQNKTQENRRGRFYADFLREASWSPGLHLPKEGCCPVSSTGLSGCPRRLLAPGTSLWTSQHRPFSVLSWIHPNMDWVGTLPQALALWLNPALPWNRLDSSDLWLWTDACTLQHLTLWANVGSSSCQFVSCMWSVLLI